MKKDYLTVDRETVLEMLHREIPDRLLAEKLCRNLEELSKESKDEKRKRQMEGINKAREKGVTLGRPRLKVPDNFSYLMDEWAKGNLKASMAARACGMGISTFYRLVKRYKNGEMDNSFDSYREKGKDDKAGK